MKLRIALQLMSGAILLALGVTGLSGQDKNNANSQTLVLKSSAFANDTYIPAKYGCDIPQAQGTPMISPPLEWANAPTNTASFALIMHDIGADPKRALDETRLDVTHWVVYDISQKSTSLPEGIAPDAQIVNGGLQGANVHDVNGYQAPCPRGIGPHYYVFDLYALDTKVNLPSAASRTQLLEAMKTHILAKATYRGLFNH